MSWGGGYTAVDPAAFGGITNPVSYATCAKLYDYPDRTGRAGARLVPEVAQGAPRVSNGGRTFVFTLRRSFRFDTGARVTAANFAWALNRTLQPALRSPGAESLADVVGAAAVQAGRRRTATGDQRVRVPAHGPAPSAGVRPLVSPRPLVLLRDPDVHPRRPARSHAGERRPVLRPASRPENARARPQPLLRRQPPGESRADRVVAQPAVRRDPAPGRARRCGLRSHQPGVHDRRGPAVPVAVPLRAGRQRLLPGAEQRPTALQGQPPAPEGGQLRDRSPRARGAVRVLRPADDRPLSAARHAGFPLRERLPARRRRTSPGRSVSPPDIRAPAGP